MTEQGGRAFLIFIALLLRSARVCIAEKNTE